MAGALDGTMTIDDGTMTIDDGVGRDRRRPPAGAGPALDCSGPVLFARYAYPPNALGYCGPPDAEALLEMAAEGSDRRGLEASAVRFDGAWPYLELIARCNGITDPLDRRVVEAYWIGNALLTRVPAGILTASLRGRFERQARQDFGAMADAVALGAPAHHSLHVFAVYPWVGLLRRGKEGPAMRVLDQCRVRWGTVANVDGWRVTVRTRALGFDGSRLVQGEERLESVRYGHDGVRLLGPLAAGDVVSLHWDWVCDRLSPGALRRLRACTARTVQAVNTLAVPGPAAICEALGA